MSSLLFYFCRQSYWITWNRSSESWRSVRESKSALVLASRGVIYDTPYIFRHQLIKNIPFAKKNRRRFKQMNSPSQEMSRTAPNRMLPAQ